MRLAAAAAAPLLASALALAPPPACPQTRPLLTEEAGTAAARTLVLEVGAAGIADEPNFLTGRPRDRFDLPVLNLVYSPAGNVELDLEWVGLVIARRDADFGNVSDAGDVTLRTKLRLLEERPGRPGISARYSLTLPETSFGEGLGPNTLRMAAQVLISKSAGGFSFHANAGVAIHDEVLRPHEQRDFLAYGLAVTRRVGRRGELVAEVAGLAGRGMPGADERSEARAGLRFGAGRFRWDAAVRRGLAAADGEWGFTAGATITIR
jgi:hypothetical protein